MSLKLRRNNFIFSKMLNIFNKEKKNRNINLNYSKIIKKNGKKYFKSN